ncbi:MAG: radical SAM protein [Clostridia bacterium]|jgi:23S rRNA (adenine2503-C2)-methyltransferase|nr:radical SAM protein [Clostridia bacterium]
MKIIKREKSNDGITIKFLQETEDGYVIETTYVNYRNKHIICYSTQVGCAIGCIMCYNGVNPSFKRSLNKDELILQCKNVYDEIEQDGKKVLFSAMGIGEPLLNYENVVNAINYMNNFYKGSKFALSTTGIKPKLILQLEEDLSEVRDFKLMISIHTVNNEKRAKLIKVNEKIGDILKFARKYSRKIEYNYVPMKGLNDSKEDILELVQVFEKMQKNEKIKINQYNIVEGSSVEKSENLSKIIEILEKASFEVEYYETDGIDINAACGQMRGVFSKKVVTY